MEKDFVDSWERHKEELRTYIEASSQKELESYQALVKILFQIVINPDLKDAPYDTDKIIVIDDGDYQGTQIYILRQAVYQPCVENYVYTHVCIMEAAVVAISCRVSAVRGITSGIG